MLTLTVIDVDDWSLWRQLRIEALREAPYAFGSRLSEWQGPGDTENRWKERIATVPLNIVARFNGEPAGMVSAIHTDADGTVELISMWVAPFARGHGVGDALIQAVSAWSKNQNFEKIALAVRDDNRHAIALYKRHGFIDSGQAPYGAAEQPPERLMVVHLTLD